MYKSRDSSNNRKRRQNDPLLHQSEPRYKNKRSRTIERKLTFNNDYSAHDYSLGRDVGIHDLQHRVDGLLNTPDDAFATDFDRNKMCCHALISLSQAFSKAGQRSADAAYKTALGIEECIEKLINDENLSEKEKNYYRRQGVNAYCAAIISRRRRVENPERYDNQRELLHQVTEQIAALVRFTNSNNFSLRDNDKEVIIEAMVRCSECFIQENSDGVALLEKAVAMAKPNNQCDWIAKEHVIKALELLVSHCKTNGTDSEYQRLQKLSGYYFDMYQVSQREQYLDYFLACKKQLAQRLFNANDHRGMIDVIKSYLPYLDVTDKHTPLNEISSRLLSQFRGYLRISEAYLHLYNSENESREDDNNNALDSLHKAHQVLRKYYGYDFTLSKDDGREVFTVNHLLIRSNFNQATQLKKEGKTDDAIASLHECLTWAIKNEEPNWQAKSYHHLALLHIEKKQWITAKTFIIEAIDLKRTEVSKYKDKHQLYLPWFKEASYKFNEERTAQWNEENYACLSKQCRMLYSQYEMPHRRKNSKSGYGELFWWKTQRDHSEKQAAYLSSTSSRNRTPDNDSVTTKFSYS